MENNKQNSTDLKVVDSIPPTFQSRSEWEGFQQTVIRAFDQGLLPDSVKSAKQAIVLAAKGRELNLEPLYALSVLYLVHGKPALEGEAMLGLALRKYPDARVQWIETTHAKAVLKIGRPTGELSTFEFTVQDALRAGIIDSINEDGTVRAKNAVWQKYTRDMLMWRAVARAVRFMFPECIQGCLLPDEAEWIPKDRAEKAVRLVAGKAGELAAELVAATPTTIETEVTNG